MNTNKRGRGRPKKEESIQIKLGEALQTLDERAANDLLEMYDVIADIAKGKVKDASATARASNAKFIIEMGEKAYKKRFGNKITETVEDEPEEEDLNSMEGLFTTDIVNE